MAKVIFVGIEQAAAGQLCNILALNNHQIENQTQNIAMRDLLGADIVFAGGEPSYYMPLLERIRQARPSLPFIVVTRIPETKEWLDALEAGATDYCSVPIETKHLHWLMENALPRSRFAAE